jgi:hypothetical protein
MKTYNIEITDTFGGEANYSWIKRYKYDAVSIRGAIQKLAREYGGGWRFTYTMGDACSFDLKGACVCLFIEEFEGE